MKQQFLLYLANNFTKKFTGCVGLSVLLVAFAVIAFWNRIKRKQTAADTHRKGKERADSQNNVIAPFIEKSIDQIDKSREAFINTIMPESLEKAKKEKNLSTRNAIISHKTKEVLSVNDLEELFSNMFVSSKGNKSNSQSLECKKNNDSRSDTVKHGAASSIIKSLSVKHEAIGMPSNNCIRGLRIRNETIGTPSHSYIKSLIVKHETIDTLTNSYIENWRRAIDKHLEKASTTDTHKILTQEELIMNETSSMQPTRFFTTLKVGAPEFVPKAISQQYRGGKRQLIIQEMIQQQRQKHIPLRKSRCYHWPRCTNNHCKFVHPSVHCRYDHRCPFREKCMFIHSSDYLANPIRLEEE